MVLFQVIPLHFHQRLWNQTGIPRRAVKMALSIVFTNRRSVYNLILFVAELSPMSVNKICISVSLSGDNSARFCNGLWTVRCWQSYVRWNDNRKLLVGRYVLPRAAGLSCAELGPSSAHHQSFRSADHSALLVRSSHSQNTVSNAHPRSTLIRQISSECVHCVGFRWPKITILGTFWHLGGSCGVLDSVVRRMNEVTLRRARLVLGWVTVFGRVYHHVT